MGYDLVNDPGVYGAVIGVKDGGCGVAKAVAVVGRSDVHTHSQQLPSSIPVVEAIEIVISGDCNRQAEDERQRGSQTHIAGRQKAALNMCGVGSMIESGRKLALNLVIERAGLLLFH